MNKCATDEHNMEADHQLVVAGEEGAGQAAQGRGRGLLLPQRSRALPRFRTVSRRRSTAAQALTQGTSPASPMACLHTVAGGGAYWCRVLRAVSSL